MKPSPSFLAWSLASSVAVAAAAEAPLGQVYHFPSAAGGHPSSIPTVDPETARLILARQLGLAHFHNLGDASPETINRLNEVARPSNDDHPFHTPNRHLGYPTVVVVDGVKDAADLSPQLQPEPIFHMANPPSPTANVQLLQDLSLQAGSVHVSDEYAKWGQDSRSSIYDALADIPGTHKFQAQLTFHHINLAADDVHYDEALEKLRTSLASLYQYAEKWFNPITLIVLPPTTSGMTKRSASPYGAYEMPQQSHHVRNAGPRFSPNVRDDDSDVVTGILPSCFRSKSDCEKITNSCSNRGKCVAKYKSKEEDVSSCFQCVCEAETRETKQGTKKTYFGGPACQKKDIVMPFWLLTFTTLFLTSAIFWGVGTLYSMGSEELPSVIGAGVSGPKAR